MNRYSRHQADLDDFPDDLVADNQLRYAAMMSTISGPQQALAYLIACETQANQALETAENQLRHNNINAATGAVECAHIHVAAGQSNTGAGPDHNRRTRGPTSAARTRGPRP